MKNLILFLVSLLTLTSCEEIIDVDLETADSKLVIDAKIERIHTNETAEAITEVEVILSLTTAFNEISPSYVNNAVVSLTDLSSGVLYRMENNLNDGRYHIILEDFEVLNDTEYLLTVIYNEETYEAREVLNPSVPIDNLFQIKNNNAFSDPEDVAVNITFTDIEGPGSHYIFKFDGVNFLATDDEFIIDGAPFNFDFFHEEPEETFLTVNLLGSDELTNNYVDSVIELAEGSNNGPFGTVPFGIRGNIVNTTNSDNFPFGYFRINEVYSTIVDLVDNEDAPEKEDAIQQNSTNQ